MIKLAGLFAMWELAKMCIGFYAIRSAGNQDGDTVIKLLLVTLEIPYWAWSVWLLFARPFPALFLWSLAMASFVAYVKFKEEEKPVWYINSAFSVIILASVFWSSL